MSDSKLEVISNVVKRELLKPDINNNDNFFNLGVSSLSVVTLQIEIENILCHTVKTKDLMKFPTISDWAELYKDAEVNSNKLIGVNDDT